MGLLAIAGSLCDVIPATCRTSAAVRTLRCLHGASTRRRIAHAMKRYVSPPCARGKRPWPLHRHRQSIPSMFSRRPSTVAARYAPPTVAVAHAPLHLPARIRLESAPLHRLQPILPCPSTVSSAPPAATHSTACRRWPTPIRRPARPAPRRRSSVRSPRRRSACPAAAGTKPTSSRPARKENLTESSSAGGDATPAAAAESKPAAKPASDPA